jgi:uncharacterized protein (DUF305 family)
MKSHTAAAHSTGHYRILAVELVVDFVIMYLVMYTMIATLDHFHFNLNNVYMTLMMVAPMRSMFPSRRTNVMILLGAAAVFAASFAGMRTQAAIGDAEFLRSMIPHHSGAILMCEQAKLSDRELIALCRDIVQGQSKEIAQMKAILARQ